MSVNDLPASGGTHELAEHADPAPGIVAEVLGPPVAVAADAPQPRVARRATPLRQTAGRLYANG